MFRKIIITMIALLPVIYFAACNKDSGSSPTEPGETIEYFPVGNGFIYIYDITGTDSAGNNFIGIRKTMYKDSTIISGTTYWNQYDTTTIGTDIIASLSYLRKTNFGVYYFLDTTGIYTSIPDTLQNALTIDPEFLAFSLPIIEGRSWTVFKILINFPPVIIDFAPVEVMADVDSIEEDFALNLTSGQQIVQAAKVKYELKWQDDPFGAPSYYDAYAWVAKDIGIVKWEGNAAVVNAMSGNGIDFADTSGVITQNLTEYHLE